MVSLWKEINFIVGYKLSAIVSYFDVADAIKADPLFSYRRKTAINLTHRLEAALVSILLLLLRYAFSMAARFLQ